MVREDSDAESVALGSHNGQGWLNDLWNPEAMLSAS